MARRRGAATRVRWRGARRAAAAAAALALASACREASAPAAAPALPERPSIVLVIGDDVGWRDYGFMGSKVARTPNLDRLAAEGVVFTHAFDTASVCRPSLQTLLTGLHPFTVERQLARERRSGGAARRFADSFETLPELLVARGYRAFAGGKFWEGSPLDAGFTDALSDWPPWRERGPLDPISQASGGYGLALGRETLAPLLEFLDAHGGEPFFVWYAPMLPHLPFDAPERYTALFRDDDSLSEPERGYYANLARLDDGVGQLIGALEQRGLRERTVVVYLADNGWDAHEDPGAIAARGLGGLGGKLSSHELGFRTPLVVSWPGELREGVRDDRLVSTLDLFPTLLELAGAAEPPGRPGVSLLNALRGLPALRRRFLLGGADVLRLEGDAQAELPSESRRVWFLRTPDWRLVSSGLDRPDRLYRIEEDPGETRDLAAAEVQRVRELRLQLAREVDALEPRPGAPPR